MKFRAKIDIEFFAENIDDIWFKGEINIVPIEEEKE